MNKADTFPDLGNQWDFFMYDRLEFGKTYKVSEPIIQRFMNHFELYDRKLVIEIINQKINCTLISI